jgi:hypothetical protein
MLKFLKSYQSIYCLLEIVDKKLKNDKVFVIEAIKANVSNFKYASDKLKDDQEVVNCILNLKDGAYQIQYSSDRFKSKKEIAKNLLTKTGSTLEYFSENIKKDKELVKIASDNDPSSIQYASKELLSDKEFLLTLNRFNLTGVPKKTFDDKEFSKKIVEIIYQDFLVTENELDSEETALLIEIFKKNKLEKETFKKLLLLSDNFTSEIPNDLQNDLEIAKILVAKDVANLESIPASLRKNKDIKTFFNHIENNEFEDLKNEDLLILVYYSGYGVIDTENVKLFAKAVKTLDDAKRLVKRETTAFRYISNEFKQNKIIIELAIADESNIKLIPKELMNDTQYIQLLLKINHSIFEYLPAEYKKDINIIKFILNENIIHFEEIEKSLQSDSAIIELVINKGENSDLSCLEKTPKTIKGQRDFAFRLAEKGYALEAFREDREIILKALERNSFAEIGESWNNDPIIAILRSGYSLQDGFLESYTKIAGIKLLEEIQRISREGKSDDLIDDTKRYIQYAMILDDLIEEEDNDYDDDMDLEEYNDED